MARVLASSTGYRWLQAGTCPSSPRWTPGRPLWGGAGHRAGRPACLWPLLTHRPRPRRYGQSTEPLPMRHTRKCSARPCQPAPSLGSSGGVGPGGRVTAEEAGRLARRHGIPCWRLQADAPGWWWWWETAMVRLTSHVRRFGRHCHWLPSLTQQPWAPRSGEESHALDAPSFVRCLARVCLGDRLPMPPDPAALLGTHIAVGGD